ncbi:hypothetical protein CYANOKiyG1_49690 [Okeania sp. KiyG1]|nr:hypothetical protein CYANOKiyG1_49690 [Okeania sp. KiyG1]
MIMGEDAADTTGIMIMGEDVADTTGTMIMGEDATGMTGIMILITEIVTIMAIVTTLKIGLEILEETLDSNTIPTVIKGIGSRE